jgi:Cof subfamily protein (haloacid dehalogenase superfamily)
MNKTLVALDMDGTLLNDEKKISPETEAYLRHLQEQGIIITLCSGRPYRAVEMYYHEIGLFGYVACCNGALILNPHDHDRILSVKAFPRKAVWKIIGEVGTERFVNIEAEDMNTIELASDNKAMDFYCYRRAMSTLIDPGLKNMAFDPLSVVFLLKDPADIYRLTQAGGASFPGIGLRFWENSLYAELHFNAINKYSALAWIAEKEHILSQDIIAFGDGDNDIEMLSRSGIGVGMKNGQDNPKRFAAMLSLDDNNHDGVMKTLKLLLPGI